PRPSGGGRVPRHLAFGRGDLHGHAGRTGPALGGRRVRVPGRDPDHVRRQRLRLPGSVEGGRTGRRTLGRRGPGLRRGQRHRVRGGEVAAGLHQAPPLHRLRRVPDPARRRARAVAAGGRLTERFPGRARSAPASPSRAACGCRSTPPRFVVAAGGTPGPGPAARRGATATPIHRQAGPSGEGAPMSAVNSVNWFELYVRDMDRARAFYEAVFGVTLQPLKPPGDDGLEMWEFPGGQDRYGANGALCRMPGVEPGPGGTVVYFATEHCGDAAERVVAAGGRILRPRMSIGPFGFVALVVDTEGHLIGRHSVQ